MSKAESDLPDTSDPEVDHFDMLFEIASRGEMGAIDASKLSAADIQQINEIRGVLSVVDEQRPVTEADLDEIDDLFMQLLAKEQPNHAWLPVIAKSTADGPDEVEVKTVGDLVRFMCDEQPLMVPQYALDFLLQSNTTVSTLVDTTQRPQILGPLLKEAGVPTAKIPEMFTAITACVNSLAPGRGGVLVARRQKKRKKSS